MTSSCTVLILTVCVGGPDSLGGLLEKRSSSEESSKRSPLPLFLLLVGGGDCFLVGGGVGGFPTGLGATVGSAGLLVTGLTG